MFSPREALPRFALLLILALVPPLACDDGASETDEEGALKGPIAVLFEIDGPIAAFDDPAGLMGSAGVSQYRLEKLIARAGRDIQVQEIVFHFGSPQIGWARAWELSDAIAQASRSSKPVTCHLEQADNITYWIAARGCPSVSISPAGGVDLVGLSLEAVFVKDLLDSMGFFADMLHVGRYKDAAETLTRNDMSPESREAATALLASLEDSFVSGIASGRRMETEDARRAAGGGPYTAKKALELGLVDRIATLGEIAGALEDEHAGGVEREYGKEAPKPLAFGEILDLISGGGGGGESRKTPRIALITAVGPIMSGSAGDDLLMGMDLVGDVDLVETLSEAARDDNVKAVVLRIDSPGGSALASDNIWAAVRALAARKPVVASMGDVAASGGYYIASAATEIFATPPTLTGSIGVVGGKVVIGDGLGKIGVHTDVVATGPRATIGSPFTPFSEEERQVITGLMTDAYDLFIDRVASGRGLDGGKVRALAEGRVWTGAQALESGLVDRAGTMAAAVERARELSSSPGLPAELYPKPKSFMEMLSEQLARQPSVLTAVRRFPSGRHALALASALRGQRVLAMDPFALEIR
jgi:protease-4